MATEKHVVNFRKSLLAEVLDGRKLEDLIRQQELGTELSFAPARRDLETILNLWNTIVVRDLQLLPSGSLEVLAGLISDSQGLFNEIAAFKGATSCGTTAGFTSVGEHPAARIARPLATRRDLSGGNRLALG